MCAINEAKRRVYVGDISHSLLGLQRSQKMETSQPSAIAQWKMGRIDDEKSFKLWQNIQIARNGAYLQRGEKKKKK